MSIFLCGCGGTRPNNLGIREGQLSPCPNSPNCISSQSHNARNRVEPFVYSSQEESHKELKKILQNRNRITIISETENYIYAECKTALFRFVDDLEFYFDDTHKVIHIRSASRIGYSDLGVNRRRIEDIRTKFIEWQKKRNEE
jgi:uncharacterized protein (DUF1499 family)